MSRQVTSQDARDSKWHYSTPMTGLGTAEQMFIETAPVVRNPQDSCSIPDLPRTPLFSGNNFQVAKNWGKSCVEMAERPQSQSYGRKEVQA